MSEPKRDYYGREIDQSLSGREADREDHRREAESWVRANETMTDDELRDLGIPFIYGRREP